MKNKRIPWNKGKRQPITDDMGNKWCNCTSPKLSHNGGIRGQAYCSLCNNHWYH